MPINTGMNTLSYYIYANQYRNTYLALLAAAQDEGVPTDPSEPKPTLADTCFVFVLF